MSIAPQRRPHGDHCLRTQIYQSRTDKLTNCIGQCERIHGRPVELRPAFPAESDRVWLFTLAIALTKDLGLFTVPVIAVTAWLQH